MKRFVIGEDLCTIGFQEHVNLNILKPIEPQLNRRRLFIRSNSADPGRPEAIKMIIDKNSSLRVNFGWSFETDGLFKEIMHDCEQEVLPNFNTAVGTMVSDLRCSWIGFVPLNIFERTYYDDMSLYSLILFNNDLIDFQIAVIKFISEHKIFKQHSMIRNDRYRFEYFKDCRNDPVRLADAFISYMESIRESSFLDRIPRDILEEQIGCHYLYHPDVFFELLEFSKLKGEIYESDL